MRDLSALVAYVSRAEEFAGHCPDAVTLAEFIQEAKVLRPEAASPLIEPWDQLVHALSGACCLSMGAHRAASAGYRTAPALDQAQAAALRAVGQCALLAGEAIAALAETETSH